MQPRTAAIIAFWTVVAGAVFNSLLFACGFVTTPWYKCLPYVVGGAFFAVIQLVTGSYALVKRKKNLSPLVRMGAIIAVVTGVCFFLYFGLALAGNDIFQR